MASMVCNSHVDCSPSSFSEVSSELKSKLFKPFRFDGSVSVIGHGESYPVNVLEIRLPRAVFCLRVLSLS